VFEVVPVAVNSPGDNPGQSAEVDDNCTASFRAKVFVPDSTGLLAEQVNVTGAPP